MYVTVTSEQLNALPGCVNNQCKSLYSTRSILDDTVLDIYVNCIYKYMTSIHSGDILKLNSDKYLKKKLDDTLKEIRDSRYAFIMSNFPPAIQRTIEVAYKDKLHKIDKKNEKFTKAKIEMSKNHETAKMCFNTLCYKLSSVPL